MDLSNIERDYFKKFDENKEKYNKEYRDRIGDKVKNSEAVFKGEPVLYSYKPMFFTSEDIENFSHIGDMMMKIGDKIADEYVKNPDFRKKFNYPKPLEDLILMDSGYGMNVPMARFDIFYQTRDKFKFCELNTDGSSAMNEDNSLGEITLQTQIIKDLEGKYKFSYYELIDSWVDKSLEIYGTWDGPRVEKPNIAILDLRESATTLEFKRFKKAYESRGLKAEIVDPRDLKYIDGNLYKGDFRIDLVYRRLVTSEMIPLMDELGDFLNAYRDRAICTIGSFRSQLIHNKLIFKVLHDKDTLKLFEEKEIAFIKDHVPYTGEFKGSQVLDHVKTNKDRYVMKPSDMNAGQGVFVGRDLSQEEWEARLDQVHNKDYIYQEFVEPFYRDFIIYKDEELQKVQFNSVVGIFMYGEEFAGLYTRVDEENVISSQYSYRPANLIVDRLIDE